MQALLAPFTSLFILALIAVFAQNQPSVIAPSTMHIRKMSYTYKEAVEEKKYMKIMISLLYHSNFVHLIFTVSILWGCLRYVEMERGTIYVVGNHDTCTVCSYCDKHNFNFLRTRLFLCFKCCI